MPRCTLQACADEVPDSEAGTTGGICPDRPIGRSPGARRFVGRSTIEVLLAITAPSAANSAMGGAEEHGKQTPTEKLGSGWRQL